MFNGPQVKPSLGRVRFLLISLMLSVGLCATSSAQDLQQINLNPDGTTNRAAEDPFISSSGRFVVFEGSFLLPDDVNGFQIYIYDRQLDLLELVSQSASGANANAESWLPDEASANVVSDDGRYVVFRSIATNLPETANPNRLRHIYVRDRQAGTTSLVSKDSDGVPANTSFRPTQVSMSPDGTWIAFTTVAALDPIDTNGNQTDIYAVKYSTDRIMGEVRLVSQDFGEVGNRSSTFPSIADNGSVAFESNAVNFSPSTMPQVSGRNIFVDSYNIVLRDGFE